MTEGGVDSGGVFHKIPQSDDARLEETFAREVLAALVRKGRLSPEWAEGVGKHMIRLIISLDRLSFLEPEGKAGYRFGQGARETETMDSLELMAGLPVLDSRQALGIVKIESRLTVQGLDKLFSSPSGALGNGFI